LRTQKFFLISLAIFFFGFGIQLISPKCFPYKILNAKEGQFNTKNDLKNKDSDSIYSELLKMAFRDSLVCKNKQILSAVNSIHDLKTILEIYLHNVDSFYTFYNSIKIINGEIIQEGIIKVNYEISGKPHSAYAYLKSGKENKTGFLVIPGSGENQAYSMITQQGSNYQKNILEILQPFGDVYILLKLNESQYAIHNGRYKLNYDFIVNYFLNRGGSYSSLYIEDGLVLIKFIKEKHRYSGIAGLSQGGLAALISALFSKPDFAIISSGYSVLLDKIEFAGQMQIIIPGIQKILNSNVLKDSIVRTKTEFLFSWGQKEDNLYGIEASTSLTLKEFGFLPNVECVIHKYGHVYPDSIIQNFLFHRIYLKEKRRIP